MFTEIVRVLEYRDHKCLIIRNTSSGVQSDWLTAYVFLPELDETYQKEVQEVHGFFDRASCELDKWFFDNVPYCTWFDQANWKFFKDSEYYGKLCCGLDLNHYWNIESNSTLNVELAESQLKEMVDYIVDNFKSF